MGPVGLPEMAVIFVIALARISHRLDPPARGGGVSPKGWERCDYSGGQES